MSQSHQLMGLTGLLISKFLVSHSLKESGSPFILITYAAELIKQSFFALRVLLAHGLTGNRLYDVVRPTIVTRMVYSFPA